MTTIQTQGVHHITFGQGWPQATLDHFDDMTEGVGVLPTRRSILIIKACNINYRS